MLANQCIINNFNFQSMNHMLNNLKHFLPGTMKIWRNGWFKGTENREVKLIVKVRNILTFMKSSHNR